MFEFEVVKLVEEVQEDVPPLHTVCTCHTYAEAAASPVSVFVVEEDVVEVHDEPELNLY